MKSKTIITILCLAIFLLLLLSVRIYDKGYSEGYESAAKLDLPENGEILFHGSHYRTKCLLTVVADKDKNCYVRLESQKTGLAALTFFVRAGMAADVEVPDGEYVLSYACGDTWLGTDHLIGELPQLFGKDTVCAIANDPLVFNSDDKSSTHLTAILYEEPHGNLQTTKIEIDEFW